eukprot:319383-Rhodomonas_salina.1
MRERERERERKVPLSARALYALAALVQKCPFSVPGKRAIQYRKFRAQHSRFRTEYWGWPPFAMPVPHMKTPLYPMPVPHLALTQHPYSAPVRPQSRYTYSRHTRCQYRTSRRYDMPVSDMA